MSDIAIRVKNLSKQYRTGVLHHDRLKDLLTSGLNGLFRLSRSPVSGLPSSEYIWALKDVSFEVKEGETVGIIGANGAGKSTLLKILSRITEPTSGRAEIYGRVGSLLEVGTGFDRELSGRENVYLNGAVLGMTKREIDRKFDEMVDFSGVEEFIDTPVKHYSSGMYVRLAFAVAAHLEPEILIVDEVLAVGDAAFQKKCLGKLGDVRREGRTILFVSHSTETIFSLCTRALLFERGKLIDQGSTGDVLGHYLQPAAGTIPLESRTDRSGDGRVRISSCVIESTNQDTVIRPNSRLRITISYRGEQPIVHPQFWIVIRDNLNVRIFLLDSRLQGGLPEYLPPQGSVTCVTDPINLTAGRFYVDTGLHIESKEVDVIHNTTSFEVEEADGSGYGKVPPRKWALCALPHEWLVDRRGVH